MPDSPAAYETITYERRGRVGLITLNRPEKLNAWNPRMETEFIDVVNRAAEDREVGVLVVTGNGRAFCAGGDISRWSDNIVSKEDRPRAAPMLDRDGSPEVPIALRRGKPVIAAINGPSIGVGLTMPLACDIRIASDRATFSVRFVKVGLTPECGSSRNLPAVAGLGNALFMALTGRIVDAEEAKERGLVDRVVPHERLMDEAMAGDGPGRGDRRQPRGRRLGRQTTDPRQRRGERHAPRGHSGELLHPRNEGTTGPRRGGPGVRRKARAALQQMTDASALKQLMATQPGRTRKEWIHA
jgi:2-(1,2-epoxy-1,2-dihydrophenyl)acetyl-CoA isomerase